MLFGKPKPAHLQKGAGAEQRAAAHLQQQGLQLVCSNFRCKHGELDLVMRDGAVLVIVEVRYRKSEQFGGALASITAQKQARIVAATQHYVIINNLSHCAIRFDVVAISGDNRLNWIKNAFQT
ncbi:YraN family protein [Methylomonas sp. EFPC3]|uniref:YraN family protein n=1 Tax=Methylomonas sp. EFPC3 TaxID=3021710 RepID=UPI002415DB24|nr:YraN family protein [Methylomonas sp. EFPC3]WFP49610.1 YraN family protein [Methylomonas sp. EFPC3]